jgi:hypothetical protein
MAQRAEAGFSAIRHKDKGLPIPYLDKVEEVDYRY